MVRISKVQLIGGDEKMRAATVIAGLIGSLVLTQAAAAHTPYLKPMTFGPNRTFVTVEAGVSGGNFFVSDFPIRGEGDYWVTTGANAPVKAASVTMLKETAVIEVALPTEGTYRISTGQRAGRSSKYAKINGAWLMIRAAGAPGQPPRPAPPAGATPPVPAGPPRFIEEAAVPAGAETMVSQGFATSETYVTRGAPDRGALKATGKGLEVEPITHPNEAFAGEAFKFRLLDNGQPAAGASFTIVRGGDAYAEKRYLYSGVAPTDGAVAVTFDQPGSYVLEARYPVRPEGARDPLPRNNTYTLTFEVTR